MNTLRTLDWQLGLMLVKGSKTGLVQSVPNLFVAKTFLIKGVLRVKMSLVFCKFGFLDLLFCVKLVDRKDLLKVVLLLKCLALACHFQVHLRLQRFGDVVHCVRLAFG